MEKLFRIALANIRKNKSQCFSFFMIILISALLLNLGLITWLGYEKNFDQKALELDTPDVVFTAQTQETFIVNEFEKELKQDDRTGEVELRDVLLVGADFEYAGGEQSRRAVFLNQSDKTSLGKVSLTEQAEDSLENPVYLPYLFQTGGGYNLKDIFNMELYTADKQKKTVKFTVAGFYEDIFLSTINNTMTGFLLPDEGYRELEEEFGGAISGTEFSVKLINPEKGGVFTTQNYDKLAIKLQPGQIIDSSFYESVKSARTITSTIGALIITCFSLLVMAVSLVIVKFRISNSIEEEMQNIGALKALGYTSRQLAASFLIQFSVLAAAGLLAGVTLSYLALPALSFMFAVQTGILWQQSFSMPALISVFLLIEILVALVSLMSSLRIRRLPPIVALRNGVCTHNFRRNLFPLDKGSGLLTALAGKQLVHSLRQNLLIGLIMLGVSFSAVFGGVMYYNIIAKEDTALILVSGEVPDAALEVADENGAAPLLNDILKREDVQTAFFYTTNKVTCEETEEAYTYVMDDFSKARNPYWNYKGRFPKYENEVAVGGLLAKLLEKEIGDTILLEQDDVKREYLITGFIQGSNFMGHDLCITGNGYRSLDQDFEYPMINIYLKEHVDTEDFMNEVKGASDDIISATNTKEVIKSSMSAYQLVVSILAIVIYLVTAAIIVLVLFLVIKTLLIRKKQEIGIQKAIGFTTWQLALQNTFAFFPVITLGTMLGCIAGYYLVNPLLGMLFSSIGVVKMNFEIPFSLLLPTFLVIVATGFLVSLLVSMRIKKITAYALMNE